MSLLGQFEDELDRFEKVIRDCPDDLWEGNLWKVKKTEPWMWPRDEAANRPQEVQKQREAS